MERRSMVFSSLLLVTVAAGLVCSAAKTAAQGIGKIYIPFAFTATHQLVPAGEYKIELLSNRFVALIDSKTGRTETTLMVRPEDGTTIQTRGRLVFLKEDGRYFLNQVWFPGSSVHSEIVVQHKPELVAGKEPARSTFEVAFR